MPTSFTKKVGDFIATVEEKNEVLSISLKSFKHMVVLFAAYTEGNIPHRLKVIVNTPDELYEVLKSLEEKDMKLSDQNELILTLKLFSIKK